MAIILCSGMMKSQGRGRLFPILCKHVHQSLVGNGSQFLALSTQEHVLHCPSRNALPTWFHYQQDQET